MNTKLVYFLFFALCLTCGLLIAESLKVPITHIVVPPLAVFAVMKIAFTNANKTQTDP